VLVIERLTYRVGPRVLLDDVNATINQGKHVGLFGKNGSGKTTLLKIIKGELEPETGSILIQSGAKIGMTSQEAPAGQDSIINFVLQSDKELLSLKQEARSADDPARIAEIHDRLDQIDASRAKTRAAKILAGLGFSETSQHQTCDSLSGGWRMRVGLAALLFTSPDILLLDEPTNHLDIESAVWLTDFLRTYAGTIIVVSHDRELLNNVAEGIVHLENSQLAYYGGNFDQFDSVRRQRLNQIESERRKQEIQKERIIRFVERFRYKATKAKQAQSRLKLLEKMQPLPDIQGEMDRNFNFPDPKPLPPPLFSLDRVSAAYEDKVILKNLSLRIDADDRIALLGANGNGKSTFIKLLAGQLSIGQGILSKSRKLKVGYFAQHQSDSLDPSSTPAIEMSRRRRSDNEEKIRNHLGGFGFSQERADTHISDLSGGEKARLLFALMSADAPNVLLLDEPTNHLDMDSRDALIQALNDFSGAVIIVSHDPYVIEMIADRLWLVEDGSIIQFDGDLNDYRSKVLRPSKTARDVGGQHGKKNHTRKSKRQEDAIKRQQLSPLYKKLRDTEKTITNLSSKKRELSERLSDPELYAGDPQLIVSLQREHGETLAALEREEAAWIEVSERIEERNCD